MQQLKLALLSCLCLCFTNSLVSAEKLEDKPAPVDDPIGLGERLALIDYLREEKKLKLPENPSLGDLKKIYWNITLKAQRNEDQLERDRLIRLKHQLESTYALVIPDNTSYEGLLAIKAKQEALAAEALKKIIADQESAPTGTVTKSNKLVNVNEKPLQAGVVLVATKTGTGSGFFINHKGYLITNRHVVGADSLGSYATIYWDATQKRDPENFSIIAISSNRDLALLKPMKAGKKYTHLKTGSSYELANDVLIAGYPLGSTVGNTLGTNAVDLTISKGSISSIRKKQDKAHFLQTDASSSQGCSGGPLVDIKTNKVLGIVTKAIDPKDTGAHGHIMTFAIPSTEIRKEFKKELP